MTPGRGGSGGFTVVEALLALLLLLLLVGGALTVATSQTSLTTRATARGEELDVERLVRTVLLDETDVGRAGRDWVVARPGVLSLRAFRGWSKVCPRTASTGELLVAVKGMRAADPEKDSVAALAPDGVWTVVDLVARAATNERCPSDSSLVVERWRLDPAVPGVVLLRFFERGSYHLEDGAFRYRRGEGGRQPLTPVVLDVDTSDITAVPGGGALVTVGTRAGATPWLRRLRGAPDWTARSGGGPQR